MTEKSKSPLQEISQLDALLREGLNRIVAAQTDLPGAKDPISEALQLSEAQTMETLAAVERGMDTVAAIRRADGQFIDQALDEISECFGRIQASQQAQDLTGQRLKKALTLLRAVEERLTETIAELRTAYGEDAGTRPQAQTQQAESKSFNQDEVDALLSELGL